MIRRACLPFVLAATTVACDDRVTPTAGDSADAAELLVPAETWQVMVVAAGTGHATATGINDAGVIVGDIIDGGVTRGFRYSAGTMTTWPATADSWISANDVNDLGQIVGSTLIEDTVRAYVRHANGTVALLPYWGPSDSWNIGWAINDVGEVAGLNVRIGLPGTDGDHVGIRWSVAIGGWKLSLLGTLLNKPAQWVHDINDSGWIVGTVGDSAWDGITAFLHKPGGPIQFIGTLGGMSTAWSINNHGRVVGTSELADGTLHAFSWTSFGGIRDEGPVSSSWIVISDRGRIAGSDRVNGFNRAFTVYKGGRAVLPLIPNGRSSYARAINTCGVIVGQIVMNDGTTRAVRWRRVTGSPPSPVCD